MSAGDVEAAVACVREDRSEAALHRVVKVALLSLHAGCAGLFDHWRVSGGGGGSGGGKAFCHVQISQVELHLRLLGLIHGDGWL